MFVPVPTITGILLFTASMANLIVLCGLEKSKGDAKRTILQGGLTINDEKVTQFDTKITLAMLESGVVMKKGKKTFHKAVLK